MGQVWHCLIDGCEQGPFDAARLRVMAEQKRLLPSHHVRLAGGEAWIVAAKVNGLFAAQVGVAEAQAQRQWAVKGHDKEFGPFTDVQLKKLAIKGELKRTHLVRIVGRSEWNEAQQVPGLFDGAPSATAAASSQLTTSKDEIKFSCTRCGRLLRGKHSLAGKTFACPACNQPVTVPVGRTGPSPTPVASASVAKAAEGSDAPVIIQAKRVGAQVAEKIDNIWKFLGGVTSSGRSQERSDFRPPKDGVKFYGAGEVVDLGRGPIKSPLVYATGQRFNRVYDASLIELPLPAARSSQSSEPLPYWPTYHEATPRQRARYLDWIYSGRNDPNSEMGFVFIFFYGLERRILVDGEDHAVVIEELLRLLTIYVRSNSFRSYATELTWLTTYLSADRGGLSTSLLSRILKSTNRWSEESLRCCLAYYGRRGIPLPLDAAAVIAEQDERSMNSIVTKRHLDKFDALFANRFNESYPTGFVLPDKFRERKIYYRAGSGTLLAVRNAPPEIASRTIPAYNLSVKHFAALSSHWNECVEELKEFDRISRKASSDKLTGELYESLPAELRTGDHPELTAWRNAITENLDTAGWPIVNVSHLAKIKGLSARTQLTKKQCTSLLATADALGIAVEPDMRLTGKNYRWDERVVLYHDDGAAIDAANLDRFRAASLLLQLGVTIATADDVVDEEELAGLAGCLEREFDLGPRLTKRLEGLKHLILANGKAETSVTAAVRKALPVAQRSMIGRFLVTIAAADHVICDKERKALKKAFRGLGIPAEELSKHLSQYDSEPAADETVGDAIDGITPIEAPALNLERIRVIREETRQVQELLHAVLTSTEGVLDQSHGDDNAVSGGASASIAMAESTVEIVAAVVQAGGLTEGVAEFRMDGVPERYRAFCQLATTKTRWRRADLSQIARDSGVMLNAACEAINEWSTDAIGDWLFEDDDEEIVVHKHLLEIS